MKLEEQIEKFRTIFSSLPSPDKELAKSHISAMLQYNKYDPALIESFFEKVERKEELLLFLQSQFSVNARRLFLGYIQSKLEESFLLEEGRNETVFMSPAYDIKYSLRKFIRVIDYMNKIGLHDEVSILLTEKIKIARKYQVYRELVELIRMKQLMFVNDLSSSGFDRLTQELEKAQYNAIAVDKVARSYTEFVNKDYPKIEVATNELKKAFKTAKYYKNRTNSTLILSYYYVLQLTIYEIERKWNKEKKVIVKLIELVSTNKLLYSKDRLAKLYVMLSFVELNRLNFQKSFEAAQNSVLIHPESKTTHHFIAVVELLYVALVVNKQEDVLDALSQLVDFRKGDKYKFRREFINYLEALFCLVTGKYEKGLKLLDDVVELNKDKVGYNPWVRIYRILLLLELRDVEKVNKELESFRKYDSRLSEREKLSPRIMLIFRLFLRLKKHAFHYSHLEIRSSEELKKLASVYKAESWNPDSPEVIFVHDWFWAKIERRDYQPNLERYQKMKNR